MKSASRGGSFTFLFTDVEGSTRLWEQDPERMRHAIARHDALLRNAVKSHRGTVVKMTGDGMHAVFDDPLDGLMATLALQRAIGTAAARNDIPLRIRCGLHSGVAERRDRDFFGKAVNRAARIMATAHGGQVLLSQLVAVQVNERLPTGVGLRDLGLVRLRDLESPERVYQVLDPNLRVDFPPLRSLEATPNNLSQQVTSFVGRESDSAAVAQLLLGTRLLTIVGAGGMGKTRLALQLAAAMIDDFPDGVWMVELAPLADQQLVPQAAASILGVKEEPGSTAQQALVKHVRTRRLLLILDNCEHLILACAELAKALLAAGPNLKVLATSREPLHVAGEVTFPLPGLGTPDPDQPPTVAGLNEYDAVRLFVDRAHAVQPAFAVTIGNAAAVAGICHRLDGIALAIELAAARLRGMTVEKIAERLSDRFSLLTGGDRTAMKRQQTLRATLDWSHDLLLDPERVVLRRLAVFAGGWTLEAAETVAATGTIRSEDVLDLLGNLTEKSLVTLDADGGRYRFLETVRQYAQQRLDESDERDELLSRHLHYHVALAETGEQRLQGPDQGAWLSEFDRERENILAAHAWCDHTDDGAVLGLTMVAAMRRYWMMCGATELGYRITVETLQRAGAHERGFARCRALFAAGFLAVYRGLWGAAEQYLEQSLSIARELGDCGCTLDALKVLGTVFVAHGDMTKARRYCAESVDLARRQPDGYLLSGAINSLAEIHCAERFFDAAEPLYVETLALCRERRDSFNAAIAQKGLAKVAIGRGQADPARALLRDVVSIFDAIGSRLLGHQVIEGSALLAALTGQFTNAARLFGASDTQLEAMAMRADPGDTAFAAPLIAQTRAALGATAYSAAHSAGCKVSFEDALIEARQLLE